MNNQSPFFITPSVQCECGYIPVLIKRQPRDNPNEFRYRCMNEGCVEHDEEYIVKMPYLMYNGRGRHG